MPSSGFGPWLLGKQGVAGRAICLGKKLTQTLPDILLLALPAPIDTLAAMSVILLNVPGTPRPQPRPRLCRGRVVSTADANARRWQDGVLRQARVAFAAHGALAGPLVVCIGFSFGTPKKDRHGKPHTFRPDVDNLAKLALDAVMKAGLFKDDASVSTLVVSKTWHNEPGMVMTIAEDRRLDLPAPKKQAGPVPDWLAN